jgi:hypothetical protein
LLITLTTFAALKVISITTGHAFIAIKVGTICTSTLITIGIEREAIFASNTLPCGFCACVTCFIAPLAPVTVVVVTIYASERFTGSIIEYDSS